MKILITGGTGLIGQVISKDLLQQGDEVVYLSREPGQNSLGIKEFGWDPDKNKIDEDCWTGVDAVINLAGAPINKRWSPEYKSTILRSRVDSTRLLFNSVQNNNVALKAVVSASAVGYYPHSFEKLYDEDAKPGEDFLSMVCEKWEQEAMNFEELDIRTVRARIGIVLSMDGGALPQIVKPVKLGLGAPLASGEQWMPWIHIRDLSQAFIACLKDEKYSGAVNIVGPSNATNDNFTREAAKVLGKPYFAPRVPKFALRLALGEMADTALKSTKVDNKELRQNNFNYKYPELEGALQDLLK